MTTWLPLAILALVALVALAALVVALRLQRRGGPDEARLSHALRLEQGRLEQALRGDLRAGREESSQAARALREELAQALERSGDTQLRAMGEMATLQRGLLQDNTRQVEALTLATQTALEGVRVALDAQLRAAGETVQGRLDLIRETVDNRLAQLQERNEAKLEEMRKTVDEQLHGTLEKRLGESFRIVSGNLEAVHRGLGEMQALAAGVGDLRRVLTNVKVRGTWAEVQLGAILEQVLTPDQYAKNVRVKEDSEERVEFAVRLPGRGGAHAKPVWLPIDSKFPTEAYLRLMASADAADAEAVQASVVELVRTVRICARGIAERYVSPPSTTDFAVLFLPTEGLYAEVLRQPGLVEQLQDTYRVVVAGPTTLAALLSSLRMGFRTLAIEQRASEVWNVLGAVKTEFGKFGEVLDKVKRQLSTASRTLTETGARTRAMERKLREVEELPAQAANRVLQLGDEGYVQLDLLDDAAEQEGLFEGAADDEAGERPADSAVD
ncbi:MAG TPA: DNA recombination protein RmuC [Thermoanaerobaculia bacterium]|nr:DNA recombination protein RmuC [Thermoanaerobaculia bacterium]